MKREEAVQLASRISDLLRSEYVFPDVADQISALVSRNAESGFYDSKSDPVGLARILTTDIQAVNHDKHLEVVPTIRSRRDTSPEQVERRLKLMREHNFGFKTIEILEPRVGYLEIEALIDTVFDGAGEAAVAAMNKLASATHLIFDMRENAGGETSMVQLLSSYLFSGEPLHLNSFRYRKEDFIKQFWTLPFVPGERKPETPVFVLINKATFSGAEAFAYNLQAMGRATIVGETSAGGANPGDFLPLTEKLDIFIPVARAMNPITNTNWEGVGVIPDIECAPSEAMQIAID
ncbi:MAG: S41 family peptidase [Pseudomonadales bacterium]